MSQPTLLSRTQDLLKLMPLPKKSSLSPAAMRALLQAHIVQVSIVVTLAAFAIFAYLYKRYSAENKQDSHFEDGEFGNLALIHPPQPQVAPAQIQPLLALASAHASIQLQVDGQVFNINLPEILAAVQDGQAEAVFTAFERILRPQYTSESFADLLEKAAQAVRAQQRGPQAIEYNAQIEPIQNRHEHALSRDFTLQDLAALFGQRALQAEQSRGPLALEYPTPSEQEPVEEESAADILPFETGANPLTNLSPEQRARLQADLSQTIQETMEPPPQAEVEEDLSGSFCELDLEDVPSPTDPEILRILAQGSPTETKSLLENVGLHALVDLAWKGFNHCTWGQIYPKEEFLVAIRDIELPEWEVPTLISNLSTINHITYLGSGAIEAWSNHLMQRYKHLKVSSGSTHSIGSVIIPDLEDGKELYAVPVIVKGKGLIPVDHIVTFIYHSTSHTLIFYDSKGKTLEDHSDSVLAKDRIHLKLTDIYEQMMQKYTKEGHPPQLWQNETKHQFDAFNCGVYVMDWIHRLTVLLPFEKTQEKAKAYLDFEEQHSISYYEASHSVRMSILTSILPTLKAPNNVPSKETYFSSAASGFSETLTSLGQAVGLVKEDNSFDGLLRAAEEDLYGSDEDGF